MKHDFPLAFDVPRETRERLRLYEALLLRWNRSINLVSRQDEVNLWRRHIEDSLQLLPLMPTGGRAIDLGSGAGFPGLVLCAVSGIAFDLIEADRRKAAFLREAAAMLNAPARVHVGRIEETRLPPAELITARALAPLTALLGLAHRFLAPAGICLFPKGRTADQELTDAHAMWNMRVERFPSRIDPDSAILRLSEVSPV